MRKTTSSALGNLAPRLTEWQPNGEPLTQLRAHDRSWSQVARLSQIVAAATRFFELAAAGQISASAVQKSSRPFATGKPKIAGPRPAADDATERRALEDGWVTQAGSAGTPRETWLGNATAGVLAAGGSSAPILVVRSSAPPRPGRSSSIPAEEPHRPHTLLARLAPTGGQRSGLATLWPLGVGPPSPRAPAATGPAAAAPAAPLIIGVSAGAVTAARSKADGRGTAAPPAAAAAALVKRRRASGAAVGDAADATDVAGRN